MPGSDQQQNHNSGYDDTDLQQVLALLTQRASGQATDQDVEEAVNQVLRASGMAIPPKRSTKSTGTQKNAKKESPRFTKTSSSSKSDARLASATARQAEQVIEVDEVDYDNDSDAEPDSKPPRKKIKVSSRTKSKKKQQQQQEEEAYDIIPLGRQGAQMMTAFGDGPTPYAGAVSATLLGARRMLQCAIQDARYLRRRRKELYDQVRQHMYKHYTKGTKHVQNSSKQEWSSELIFRAMQGYDPLAYDPKSGLGVEELKQLFPEEMNAYQRWNEMHNEYADSSADNGNPEALAAATRQQEEATETSTTTGGDTGGHLLERMINFDVRTDKMQNDWYLTFSDIRQRGSFLPRRGGTKQHAADSAWDQDPARQRGRGQHSEGNWAHMTAGTVRFLHWVGFDPESALPPPNDATTQALAFLAHDFVGRIVEKAILLRTPNDGDSSLIPQLDDGEHLDADDIEAAMKDINPAPLYGSVGNGTKKAEPQLYFGPGFEDRLEMELEEMLGQKPLSEEERKTRLEEDLLFARLSAPPSQDGVQQLLGAKRAEAASSTSKKPTAKESGKG